ncbi:twin-arginine translocation signal domain-containing protein [Candidatus Microgenomates bacterium]|jgi:hypothetical protein|nr:MAG: twin-arginine translocation signal domain-containing protein [Candidatus Microgenomates bacterium]
MERIHITRRDFLKFTAGVTSAFLAGCLPEGLTKTLETSTPTSKLEATKAVTKTPTETVIPTKTATPTLTKEPTSTPTLTATNTPEPTATLEPIAAVIENAPQIRGLRVERQGENLHYIAEAGNPYGLKEGERVGIIKENVYVGEEKTGGIVLDSRVARAITLEENRKHLFTFLPVDISKADEDIRVSSRIAPERTKFELIRIEYTNKLPVTSPYTENTTVYSASNGYYGQIYFENWRLFPDRLKKIAEGEELRYLIIGGNYLEKLEGPAGRGKHVNFGDVLTEAKGYLYFLCGSLEENRGLTMDSVSLNGIPVFLKGN